MSWEFFADTNYFVFEGYYEVLDDWTSIDICYVDKASLERLLEHWRMSNFWTTGVYVTEQVLLLTNGTSIPVELVNVTTIDGPLLLYQLKASDVLVNPFFDYDYYTDKRIFTATHIQEAVVHGLNEGIAAGLKGTDTIDGLSPAEYTWMYTAYLKDPTVERTISTLANPGKSNDGGAFTFAYIHAAVIHGLNEGIAPGLKGAESIGRRSPVEYAALYTSNVMDPIEQVGIHDFKLQTSL